MCIYGFLEETEGSVFAQCACQSARASRAEHVSKTVSMQRVEQLNSVFNSPGFRGGQLSLNLRQEKRHSALLFTFFFTECGVKPLFALDSCFKGCNVADFLRNLDIF